jgi:hypothetical protein
MYLRKALSGLILGYRETAFLVLWITWSRKSKIASLYDPATDPIPEFTSSGRRTLRI